MKTLIFLVALMLAPVLSFAQGNNLPDILVINRVGYKIQVSRVQDGDSFEIFVDVDTAYLEALSLMDPERSIPSMVILSDPRPQKIFSHKVILRLDRFVPVFQEDGFEYFYLKVPADFFPNKARDFIFRLSNSKEVTIEQV